MVNGHWALHVTVRSPEGDAECVVDAKAARFGDGYALTYDTDVNDAAELLMRVSATAPDGAMSAGVIRLNRLTNEATTTGLNDVACLLSTSRDARLLRAVLPGITSQMRSRSGKLTPVVNASADCALLVVGVFIAVDAAVAACAIPEPVEPYACSAAVAAVGVATGAMAYAGCTNDIDNTIGWG